MSRQHEPGGLGESEYQIPNNPSVQLITRVAPRYTPRKDPRFTTNSSGSALYPNISLTYNLSDSEGITRSIQHGIFGNLFKTTEETGQIRTA